MSEPFRLPMFPLGSTVFPTQLIPLHVFEPRYRALMNDVLTLESDQRFGIALIERGFEVGGGDQRTDVATRVELVQAEEFDDGRWGIVAAGIDRIDVLEWLDDDPYPVAMVRVRERSDDGGDLEAAEAIVFEAIALVAELSGTSEDQFPDAETLADDRLVRLDQLSALAPLSTFDRQQVLAAETTTGQIAELTDATSMRIELLRGELGS